MEWWMVVLTLYLVGGGTTTTTNSTIPRFPKRGVIFARHPHIMNETYNESLNSLRSFTKTGNIFVAHCPNADADAAWSPLYPSNVDPFQWRSCGDAYEFTWRNDFYNDLISLNRIDKEKLIRSMGFCPHHRCQLKVNISNSGPDGQCPVGLCYTKLENGGLSYGACCFHDGVFNSGELIGFYNKTQRQSKPIYKRSRIVLGGNSSDESFGSFINANRIHSGIVATQCPLPSTISDVKRMIVEQNISLWIQLAPFTEETSMFLKNSDRGGEGGGDRGDLRSFRSKGYLDRVRNESCTEETTSSSSSSPSDPSNTEESKGVLSQKQRTSPCQLFPNAYLTNHSYIDHSDYSKDHSLSNYHNTAAFNRIALSDLYQQSDSSGYSYNEQSFTLTTSISKAKPPGSVNPPATSENRSSSSSSSSSSNSSSSNSSSSSSNSSSNSSISGSYNSKDGATPFLTQNTSRVVSRLRKIDHIWFHKWEDFQIPSLEDTEELLSIAHRAVSVIRAGGTIAVSCLSGRGRTGTFSALVVGLLHDIKTHSELVDIIVQMRERRDGIVETPQQFRYIVQLLGLPDTGAIPFGVFSTGELPSVTSVLQSQRSSQSSQSQQSQQPQQQTTSTSTSTTASASPLYLRHKDLALLQASARSLASLFQAGRGILSLADEQALSHTPHTPHTPHPTTGPATGPWDTTPSTTPLETDTPFPPPHKPSAPSANPYLSPNPSSILPSDASVTGQMFKAVGLDCTEGNRRTFRTLMLDTKGIEKFVGGVTLDEESLRLSEHLDTDLPPSPSLVSGIIKRGMTAGVKIANSLQVSEELEERLSRYHDQSLRYAVWTSSFHVTDVSSIDIRIHGSGSGSGSSASTTGAGGDGSANSGVHRGLSEQLRQSNSAQLRDMVRFSLLCQRQLLVPIIEVRVTFVTEASIEAHQGAFYKEGETESPGGRGREVDYMPTDVAGMLTEKLVSRCMQALLDQEVELEALLLQLHIVRPSLHHTPPPSSDSESSGGGASSPHQLATMTAASRSRSTQATIRVLQRAVPCAVPAVAISITAPAWDGRAPSDLSGGLSDAPNKDELAILSAMHHAPGHAQRPWAVSYSLSLNAELVQSLQLSCMLAWRGLPRNIPAAQGALYAGIEATSLASRGMYQEKELADATQGL